MTFKVTRHIGGRKEAERGNSEEFLARGVYIRRRRSANSFEKNDPNLVAAHIFWESNNKKICFLFISFLT